MRPNYIDKKIVSLVAPSFGCTTSPYNKRLTYAIKNLKKEGFTVYEGENIYKNEGLIASNTPIARAEEIMDAYKSDSEAIISVGGGELMIEMLEYIDFDVIKNNPKWFMGFSDNTNLCYTITTILDIETIYGSNIGGFSLYPFQYDVKDSLSLLKGKNKIKSFKRFILDDESDDIIPTYHFNKRIKMINHDFTKAHGRIIGGCLDCLVSLCGTKYDKTIEYMKRHKDEGIIFFMEACDLNSVSLVRALTQLKYAGWFDLVDYFIIGMSRNYHDKSFGLSMTEAYDHVLLPLKKPVILNASIGHIPPSTPIKVGGVVDITLNNNELIFEYKD